MRRAGGLLLHVQPAFHLRQFGLQLAERLALSLPRDQARQEARHALGEDLLLHNQAEH